MSEWEIAERNALMDHAVPLVVRFGNPVKEVARLLGVCEKTLRRRVAERSE